VGTGAHEAVSVHGIDATEAAALHCGLLARRRHAQPHRPDLPHLPSEGSPEHPAYGPGAADGDFTEENTAPERTIAAFSPAWLRFAPFTMSGVATVLTAWAIGGRIVNEFQLGDTVTPWVDRLRDATAQLSLLVLVLTVLIGGLVLVSVLSGRRRTPLANWGYRLTRRGDATLYVRRGLLTSRAMTIEERRLRGVVLERPLLLRIPRGARAKALVTGGKRRSEEGARATHLLVPPAPAALVRAAAGDVLGTATPLTAPLLGHGPRAVRRRHTRALLGLAPVAATVAGAAWWWHWPRGTYVVAVLVLALAPVLATLRARSLGHAVLGDPRVLLGPDAGYLVGPLGGVPAGPKLPALPRGDRLGAAETFFQRRAGLVTLEATVATSRGKIRILDVPRARALEIVRDATPGLLDRYLEP
jgi:putative membrane protein